MSAGGQAAGAEEEGSSGGIERGECGEGFGDGWEEIQKRWCRGGAVASCFTACNGVSDERKDGGTTHLVPR